MAVTLEQGPMLGSATQIARMRFSIDAALGILLCIVRVPNIITYSSGKKTFPLPPVPFVCLQNGARTDCKHRLA